MMVNIRRNEGGFPRKEFASPASSFFLDLLFFRHDELWSTRRPGIIYIVPTSINALFDRRRISPNASQCVQEEARSAAAREEEALVREEKKGSRTQSKTPSSSQRTRSINATKTRKTLQRVPSNATSLLPLKSSQCYKYYQYMTTSINFLFSLVQFSKNLTSDGDDNGIFRVEVFVIIVRPVACA